MRLATVVFVGCGRDRGKSQERSGAADTIAGMAAMKGMSGMAGDSTGLMQMHRQMMGGKKR